MFSTVINPRGTGAGSWWQVEIIKNLFVWDSLFSVFFSFLISVTQNSFLKDRVKLIFQMLAPSG